MKKRFDFHYLQNNLLWFVLILFSIGALYVNGLDIRYASRDDLSISSVFQHNVFHQAATAAKAEGRFYFCFIVPISSAIFQIQSNVLFAAIRLLPYFFGLVGFAYFLNRVCAQHMPFLPTLAICLVFTGIWPAYTPILGFPWWFSLGFCAFAWGACAWLKWSETHQIAAALCTFLLFAIALCTCECFVPMLAAPAFAIFWKSIRSHRESAGSSLRRAALDLLPPAIVVVAYLSTYFIFRAKHPSTYAGNQPSFDLAKIFLTWFHATVTPLPGWAMLRSDGFIQYILPKLPHRLAALCKFAREQPLYSVKAFLVGLSIFGFYLQQRKKLETESISLVPLLVLCLIGSLSPNLLISLSVKYQQAGVHELMPYIFSFFSLPFSLVCGLLLLGAVSKLTRGPAWGSAAGCFALLYAFLTLSSDYVSSASVRPLRVKNLEWRVIDDLVSSGCLTSLQKNSVIYAPSLDANSSFWSSYFSARLGRAITVLVQQPSDEDSINGRSRFFFSFTYSPANWSYFWQFGPIASDHTGSRQIQIGEFSKRVRFRLDVRVPTDEPFVINLNGRTYSGNKYSFDGIQLAKRTGNPFLLLSLEVRSRDYPILVPNT